jgi:hypothetical protein
MGRWYIDRRHEVIDILQAARLTQEELAQATALGRHFSGATGQTHPGVESINFLVARHDAKKGPHKIGSKTR